MNLHPFLRLTKKGANLALVNSFYNWNVVDVSRWFRSVVNFHSGLSETDELFGRNASDMFSPDLKEIASHFEKL